MAIKKKPTIKKLAKRKSKAKKAYKKRNTAVRPKEKIIGKVTHYFPHVRAAVVKLKNPLAIDDLIHIKGHTTDFTQTIISLQIDHRPIQKAKKGQEIGLSVNSRVRRKDIVYKA